MANDIGLPGAIAGGDLSTRQFYAVKMSETSGNAFEVAAMTSGGQRPIGILQNDPNTSGQGAEVMLTGISKVALGGNVTQGDALSNDSFGRLAAVVLSSSLAAPGRYIVGTALQSGNTSGIIYAVIHQPYLISSTT